MFLYSTFILYHRNSFFCIHNRECYITLLTLKGYCTPYLSDIFSRAVNPHNGNIIV